MIPLFEILNTQEYIISDFTENTNIGDIIRTNRFGDLLITDIYSYCSPIKWRYSIHYESVDKKGKYYILKLNRKKRYDTII